MEDINTNNSDQVQQDKGFFKVQPGQSSYSESSSSALLGLFFYSMLMFTLPLLSFFGSKHLFEYHWELSPTYKQFAPAIIAVVVTNLVIISYVIKAFREEAKENSTNIQHTKRD